MSKIKPILFSTAMVQAILDGRKTQTRRKTKINTDFLRFGGISTTRRVWDSTKEENPNPIKTEAVFLNEDEVPFTYKSKYQTGDIIWVREKWRVIAWGETQMCIEYADDSKYWCDLHCPDEDFEWIANYQDKMEEKGIIELSDDNEMFQLIDGKEFPWKPSIFMPKEACRIFLECTNVRVERLQDITETDAIAEGIKQTWKGEVNKWKNYVDNGYGSLGNPIDSFKSLWYSINGDISWRLNPWVWVYDFKRVEKPKDFI